MQIPLRTEQTVALDSEFNDEPLRAQFTVERHRREEAEREVSALRTAKEGVERVSLIALRELEDVSGMLSKTRDLAEWAEILNHRVAAQEAVIQRFASLALRVARTHEDKGLVSSLCREVGILPHDAYAVHGVFGLPRLRVFSDEPCVISLSLLGHDGPPLFSSEPIEVFHSPSEVNTWMTSPNSPAIHFPRDFFTGDPGLRIGIVFDSCVIAETKSLTQTDFEQRIPIPLFHNDIPIPGCEILLAQEPETRAIPDSSGSLELRIIAVDDVASPGLTGSQEGIAIVLECLLQETDERVLLPIGMDFPQPSLSLGVSLCSLKEVHVQFYLRCDSAILGVTELVVSTVERDEWLLRTLHLSRPAGGTNGTMDVEYRVISGLTPSAAYRSG